MEIKPGELLMGVGDGGGNLFVRGDYDSIKVLQDKLLELEDLRKQVDELDKEVQEKNIELTRVRLEVSTLRASRNIPNRPGFIDNVPYCGTQKYSSSLHV